jgi:putative cardiolipin synthase
MRRHYQMFRTLGVLCVLLSIGGCMSLPTPSQPGELAPQPHAEGSWLSKTFAAGSAEHPTASGFHLFSAGIDGLLLRLELIDRAQQSLDLQYYIFRSDDTGRLIQQSVLRAADRGVHVRIITDDGETVRGDEKLLSLAAHPHIEVRVFNPFGYRGHNKALRSVHFLLHKSRLDYRMHNKLMVVDGTVAVTGGRNIGNQYFQVDPDSQFGDDDVMALGPVVDRLAVEFADYWNSPAAVPAERLRNNQENAASLQRYRNELNAPGARPDAYHRINDYAVQFDQRLQAGEPLRTLVTDASALTWANATVLYDSPQKREIKQGEGFGRLMYQPVAEKIAAARSELLMITPYFVPIPNEVKLLALETREKVAVRILTNSLPAAPDVLAQAGYARHRLTLLKDGVELYEIRADLGNRRGSGESQQLTRYGTYALHAKLFVFDRTALFVGSMNLDERSVRLNTEMGLIIESEPLASIVANRFNALTAPENAYHVTLTPSDALVWRTHERGSVVELHKEPARSGWQRFELHFLELLPLDREL